MKEWTDHARKLIIIIKLKSRVKLRTIKLSLIGQLNWLK